MLVVCGMLVSFRANEGDEVALKYCGNESPEPAGAHSWLKGGSAERPQQLHLSLKHSETL